MVKVIAGIYKGRNLDTPINDTKPTKGSVKEAIFSSIRDYLNNSIILDLFAGSGAFGIEGLSRGAKYCVFNDSGREQNKILRKNTSILNIKNCEILNLDYKLCLSKLISLNLKFNVIFVDPPYAMDCYEEIMDAFINNELLEKDSVVVLESNHFLDLKKYESLFNIKEKKYGYTIVNILRKL